MKNIESSGTQIGGEVFYTISQVCELLGIDEVTLWRKTKFEGLKRIKAGGLVRYRKSTLDKWLADHESE